MDILSNLADLSDERLTEYAAEVRSALDALVALDAPTAEQVSEAEGYADHLDVIATEQQTRTNAAQELADRVVALRSRFAETDENESDEVETDEVEVEVEEPVEVEVEIDQPAPVAARGTVATLSRRVRRPVVTRPAHAPISITAAADVPDFATGSRIEDMGTVTTALINRMRGFGTPSGDGTTENLQHYGVASFHLDFPKELTIDRHSDDMEVLARAADEHRLPGGSLVASAGWCAPSETIYDLCGGETTDGIVSVPEVKVARGGIKYTTGPDFSAIYTSVGFCQTEAQAIAGTAKTCFEVPCPAFVDVRLDACGLCIKAPILLNAAYPELVQRWLSGSMVAHQHKMNAKVLAAIAAGSTAVTFVGAGATTTDTMEALTLYGDRTRQKFRLGIGSTLEVVVPFWVRDAIRADMSRRSAVDTEAITDAIIDAEFAARSLNVQYAYDWQELPYSDAVGPPIVDADKWPATFDALMYPAGGWIKGTSDVINLNAVYDAASLATNIYTALFFEQGILVAKQCYDSLKVTIPVCGAGRSGTQNLTCP